MRKSSSDSKVLEVLGDLIPGNSREQVASVIENYLENSVQELDSEYNRKLEEAYSVVHEELKEAERTAEKGYAQAWDMICNLRDRLELQRVELEHSLEKGYNEAYEMLMEERNSKNSLETEYYEEYENKLSDVKKFIVKKVSRFLDKMTNENFEEAKRQLLNDPNFAEQKLAFDKILEVASSYISDEDVTKNTSNKAGNLARELEEAKSQLKLVESKSMRLMMENNKLNEAVRNGKKLLTESVRKDRIRKAKKVEGRGVKFDDNRRELITENKKNNNDVTSPTVLNETIGEEVLDYWDYVARYQGDSQSK